MNKSNLIFYAICIAVLIWFVSVLFVPKVSVEQIYTKPTPTINYYLEDLYAQCNGLKYFDAMKEEYESLEINENFKKEYQKTLSFIERDKTILGYEDFNCP